MCKDFRETAFEMSLKGQVDVCLCREGEKGRRMFPAEEPTFAKVDVTKKKHSMFRASKFHLARI